MKRVAIIGGCGAGKSTLARELHRRTGLPVIHLDQLFWNPGWIETEKSEFARRLASVYAQPEWIIDGNYSLSMAERLARADTVYHLDYPTRVCFARTVKRIFKSYGKVRNDSAPGCPEHFDLEFLHFTLNFRRNFHQNTLNALASAPHLTVHRFQRPRDLEHHLNSMPVSADP